MTKFLSPNYLQSLQSQRNAYARQGSDTSPVGHWTQALARGLSGLNAGILRGQEQAYGEKLAAQKAARANQMTPYQKAKLDLDMKRLGLEERSLPIREKMLGLKLKQLQSALKSSEANTPAARRALGESMGLTGDKLTRFSLTGTYKPTSPTEKMRTEILQGLLNKGRPAQPPAQPPQAGLKPMSAPGAPQMAPGVQQTSAGGLPPQIANAIPPMPGGAPPSPVPQMAPGIQRTQTAAPVPQQPPVQPGQPQGSMFGGTIAEKRRNAEMMMLSGDPGMKAMGEQLMKDINKQMVATKTRGDLEAKLVATKDNIASLSEMMRSFSPEFQTILGKVKGFGAAWIEKAGGTLDPKTREYLDRFTDYRTQGFQFINNYIKSVTGAQMSEAEAKRLRQGVPDVGDEVLSGDSPTQFRSKMVRVMKAARLAQARYTFMLKKGVTYDPNDPRMPSLGQMEREIEKAGKRIENMGLQQGLRGQQLNEFVDQGIRQEFGIDA